MNDKEILDIVNHFVYFVKYNKLQSANEIKKFVYTRNFTSEEIKEYKDLFTLYGEMNVYNCIISYINKTIPDKEILLKKIKGTI